ncbi:TonB-dependent receptor [Parahaliea sp. F7430]|uniref:TonB-dependent receptor n=1 Tax=Sediminihaliea albiluteola TaxID=2758564 RepID=A0A7W2YIW2_9GAMM|nr:TonB-dependent receptor [Sediminihaliea albiluteola]MBA6412520.1 TonB-dependent receptor [Sediminihaliea albiluteola]
MKQTLFSKLCVSALLCTAANSLASPAATPEHVLVTATRSAQDGLRSPLSYSGLEQDALSLTAAVHPNELMQRVSGTWISRGNGQESLTALRSPVLTGAGGCGSFLMAADNISLRAPGFCNVNQLFDANIEQAGRLEVIKGPGTAVYGASAMHGVINVLSAAPDTLPAQAISFETGPNDYYRGSYQYAAQQGSHGISLRLNGSTDGGYLDDAGYDQQKLSLRHDYDGGQWQLQSVVEGSNLNQETAGFIEGYKAYKDNALRRNNPNPEAYRDAWSLRAYSQASIDLAEGKVLQITPYYRNNSMEFLQHFLPWQAIEKNGHDSFGLRAALSGASDSLQWISGIDLDYTRGWLKETQPEPFSPNQPAGVHYDYEVNATSAATFAQLTWQASERWTIDSGLRLEHTRYDYDNRSGDGSACAPGASACRFFRPADRRDEFDNWSLNLGGSYEFSAGQYLFLRAANGFRAPETAELYRLQAGQQVAKLDSERIDNIELGLKGALAEQLLYSLSLFSMHKDDVIFQDADRHNVSGAKTRHHGLELSLDYQLNDAWYAGLDLTRARHRYDSNAPLLGVSESIKGNDIDTAPRLFGSARLGWRSAQSQAELEWVYMDEYYLEPTNRFKYDGHQLLNLRASTSLSKGLSASVRLTNLLNEKYAERADVGFGEYRYFVGQRRGVYLQLNYSLPQS